MCKDSFRSSLFPRLDCLHHNYVLVTDLIGPILSPSLANVVEICNEEDGIYLEHQNDANVSSFLYLLKVFLCSLFVN